MEMDWRMHGQVSPRLRRLQLWLSSYNMKAARKCAQYANFTLSPRWAGVVDLVGELTPRAASKRA